MIEEIKEKKKEKNGKNLLEINDKPGFYWKMSFSSMLVSQAATNVKIANSKYN